MKKGMIASDYLGWIILTLVGFGILLFFLFYAFSGTDSFSSRESCKLSVLTRATIPNAAQSQIPLKCTTEKICLSADGGKGACYQFAGQQNIRAVKLRGTIDEQARVIEEESANALYDCWSMMGQGKLDLFGKGFTDSYSLGQSRCVVCSRVALAKDVPADVLAQVNINRYLRENKVPGTGLTYLQTFSGGSGEQTFTGVDFGAYQAQVNALDKLSPEERAKLLEQPQTDQLAFVFAQRKSPNGFGDGFLSGTADASYVVIGATALVPGATSALFSPQGIFGTIAFAGGLGTWKGVASWWDQSISAGYCGKFSSAVEDESNRKGCSLVRAVPYSADTINSICQVIEGDL